VKYVALLRGINVGKSVKVPMKELIKIFEELGFANILTYLNSGNAIFESKKAIDEIEQIIEKALYKKYSQTIPTLIITSSQIKNIAKAISIGWNNVLHNKHTLHIYLRK
jgi:uncharacterized protein (DUF1697 family)